MNTVYKKEVMSLLKMPFSELILKADRARAKYIGTRIDICSIVNAKSGLCSQDCKFCAQSLRHKTKIATYPLKDINYIVKMAKRARGMGAQRFGIVTSGNRLNRIELEKVAKAISNIRKKAGIIVCASLGALGYDELRMLKDAGLKRYHHNIETSPHFYPRIVSTHSFKERLRTIRQAKKAGLEVCSGGIVGMGEGWQDRIEMARILKEVGVDSIPINLLIPIKGTPMESLKPISCEDAIKTIAIFRIILKDKTIKIAAGRESLLKDFQAMAFMAGANGLLIGGYLTTKGRDASLDHSLIKEVKEAWRG